MIRSSAADDGHRHSASWQSSRRPAVGRASGGGPTAPAADFASLALQPDLRQLSVELDPGLREFPPQGLAGPFDFAAVGGAAPEFAPAPGESRRQSGRRGRGTRSVAGPPRRGRPTDNTAPAGGAPAAARSARSHPGRRGPRRRPRGRFQRRVAVGQQNCVFPRSRSFTSSPTHRPPRRSGPAGRGAAGGIVRLSASRRQSADSCQ